MSVNPLVRRRMTLLVVTIAALGLIALSGTRAGRAETGHGHANAAGHGAVANHKQAAFHDAMRKLWEDHITWTRLAIVSFAADGPDLAATEQRLLRNQVDIGNAIKPYYGRAAANQLTALLKQHILGAVALLQAAKAGDQALVQQRMKEWRVNGNAVADFLARANPRHWPRKTMRRMMRMHLEQTVSEAVHRLQGDYAADVRDYDVIHHHILAMADALSDGIIAQFPKRFGG